MPFARAAVRQTGGRTPLGLVEKGTLIGLITEAVADDVVLQAICVPIRSAVSKRGLSPSMNWPVSAATMS